MHDVAPAVSAAAMTSIPATAETAPVAEKGAEAVARITTQEVPDHEFPRFETAWQTYFIEEKGHFWVGMSLSRMDYLEAIAVLDKCKLDILSAYKSAAEKAAKLLVEKTGQSVQKSRLITPGVGGAGGGIRALMQKLTASENGSHER